MLSGAQAVAEQDLDPHAKICIYGPPGVGKTGFASDADLGIYPLKPEEILYLNVESGKLTLKVLGRGCKVIDIVKMTGDQNEIEARRKRGEPTDPFTHLELVHRELMAGGHGFKAVVIDSLSSLQKEDLDTVAQVSLEKSSKDNRVHGRFGKQQADYGINTDKMRWLIRAYRDLPMTVVFICGETKDKDNVGTSVTVPDLTPKLRESLYPAMDIVLYMYNTTDALGDDHPAGEIKRVVLAAPIYPQFRTKDRSGALGNFQVNATLPKILKIISEKINKATS